MGRLYLLLDGSMFLMKSSDDKVEVRTKAQGKVGHYKDLEQGDGNVGLTTELRDRNNSPSLCLPTPSYCIQIIVSLADFNSTMSYRPFLILYSSTNTLLEATGTS